MSAADDVKKAWTVPGRSPAYHQEQQRLLRDRWPVLAEAIEKLVRETPSAVGLTEEPVSVTRNGPKPKLRDGAPIMQHHPQAGQTYLAADGSGWWRADVMPEDTRQHQIADLLLEHHRDNIKGCSCGWGMDGTKLGQSHADHVADVILKELGL